MKFKYEHNAQSTLNNLKTESYNGWPTYWFLQEDFKYWPKGNPESDVKKSPFWFADKRGSGELSFEKYLKANHKGSPPDLVFIMLGTNDIAGKGGNAELLDSTIKRALKSIDSLIALMKKANPKAKIIFPKSYLGS